MLCHYGSATGDALTYMFWIQQVAEQGLRNDVVKAQMEMMTGSYMKKWMSVLDYVVLCLFFRLLVGAPRARALGKQAANITGGLYKCEITQSNKCERVEFDNEGDLSIYICLSVCLVWMNIDVDIFDLCFSKENVQTENKENQWMGVTVQSQGPGGKIVVSLSSTPECCFQELSRLVWLWI